MLFACNSNPASMTKSAATSTASSPIIVSGNASYLQRIAMPPEAILTVQLEDVSLIGAPATVLAKQQIPFNARQVPIPFSININNNLVDPKHSYVIRASISVADSLRFTTLQPYAVLTQGASNQVNIIMQPATADTTATIATPTEKPASELINTRWKLIELNGKTITMTADQHEEIHITLAENEHRVSGFSGCNRMMGAYELEGDRLQFKQLAGTMMACISPMMENENAFVKTLAHTTNYHINGEHLILLNNQKVIARFSALYLK
jgi:putative lipoprotein